MDVTTTTTTKSWRKSATTFSATVKVPNLAEGTVTYRNLDSHENDDHNVHNQKETDLGGSIETPLGSGSVFYTGANANANGIRAPRLIQGPAEFTALDFVRMAAFGGLSLVGVVAMVLTARAAKRCIGLAGATVLAAGAAGFVGTPVGAAIAGAVATVASWSLAGFHTAVSAALITAGYTTWAWGHALQASLTIGSGLARLAGYRNQPGVVFGNVEPPGVNQQQPLSPSVVIDIEVEDIGRDMIEDNVVEDTVDDRDFEGDNVISGPLVAPNGNQDSESDPAGGLGVEGGVAEPGAEAEAVNRDNISLGKKKIKFLAYCFLLNTFMFSDSFLTAASEINEEEGEGLSVLEGDLEEILGGINEEDTELENEDEDLDIEHPDVSLRFAPPGFNLTQHHISLEHGRLISNAINQMNLGAHSVGAFRNINVLEHNLLLGSAVQGESKRQADVQPKKVEEEVS